MAAEARLNIVLRHLRETIATSAEDDSPAAAWRQRSSPKKKRGIPVEPAAVAAAAVDPKHFQSLRLTPSVGAEVTGVSLSEVAKAPSLVAEIDALLLEHGVLVFRGQRGVDTERQLALLRALNAHWGLRAASPQQAKSYQDGAFVIRMLPSKPGTQSTIWNVSSHAATQQTQVALNKHSPAAAGYLGAQEQHRWPYHRLLRRSPPHSDAGPMAKFALAYGGSGQWTRRGQEMTYATNVWHSDDNYVLEPPWVTILRSVEVPPCGGDTMFADMGQAMLDLSEDSAQLLRSLAGVCDWRPVFPHYADPSAADTAAELRKLYPPVAHPVVRTHPATGREALYCNAIYTQSLRCWADGDGSDSAALGPPPAAAEELLRELLTLPGVPEYQCRVRWRGADDVLLWDNRRLQHYAVSDFGNRPRHMEHCASLGDVPYLLSPNGGPKVTSRLLTPDA